MIRLSGPTLPACNFLGCCLQLSAAARREKSGLPRGTNNTARKIKTDDGCKLSSCSSTLRSRLRFRDVFDKFFSVTFEYTHGWIECREGKRFITFVVTHLSPDLCSVIAVEWDSLSRGDRHSEWITVTAPSGAGIKWEHPLKVFESLKGNFFLRFVGQIYRFSGSR